jgi:hypothetical protein
MANDTPPQTNDDKVEEMRVRLERLSAAIHRLSTLIVLAIQVLETTPSDEV